MANTKYTELGVGIQGKTNVYVIANLQNTTRYLDPTTGLITATPVSKYNAGSEHTVMKGTYILSEARAIWPDGQYTFVWYQKVGGAEDPTVDTYLGTSYLNLSSDKDVTPAPVPTVNALDLTTVADFVAVLGLGAPTQAQTDMYQRLITAASTFLQTHLNRVFASAAYTENRDGYGGRVLPVKNYPLLAVSSLTIDGVAIPVSTSMTVSGFLFSTNAVYLRGYKFNKGLQNISISYTAGYSVIPADIAQATQELVGRKLKLFNNKGERLGMDSQVTGGMQVNFSKSDITAEFKSLLKQYQRVMPI